MTADAPRNTKRTRTIIGVALGVAALYAAVSSAGGWKNAIDAIWDASPTQIGYAIAGSLVGYIALGFLLHRLSGREALVSPIAWFGLGLVLNGLGNVLPAAPAEGLILTGSQLQRRGMSPRQTGLTLGFAKWFTARAVFMVVALDAFRVAIRGGRHYPKAFPGRVYLGLAAVAVVALLVFSAWFAQRRRTAEWVAVMVGQMMFWRPHVPADEHRAKGVAWHVAATEVLGPRRRKALIFLLSLVVGIGDIACFRFSMAAAGLHARSGYIIIAYGASVLATWIPMLPAGLGAVEAAVITVLVAAKVPADTALTGVLVYRGAGTLLAALGGTVALVLLRVAKTRDDVIDLVEPPVDAATSQWSGT